MYVHTFLRNELGMGSASAVMMLMTVAAIMVPYLYSETRAARRTER
jgi:glucose/mannose transport system permease protein